MGTDDKSVGELWREEFQRQEDSYQTPHPQRAFFLGFLRSPYIKKILKFADLRRQDRVLEGGCGSGKFSACFAVLGFRVMALDYSPRMVTNALGLRRAAEEYFGRLELDAVVGDLNHLPFAKV